MQTHFYQISVGMARPKGGKTIRKDKILVIANSIQVQYIVCLEVTSSRKPLPYLQRGERNDNTEVRLISSKEPVFEGAGSVLGKL